jgi:tetratricopeptide (TPR) repeat protein
LKLMQGIAAGLTHAHRRGIVHRDLKPANVLIREDEEPLLLDFNLAADLRGGDARSEEIGGTLPYMAPEQLASLETGERTDARADVYACGVLWFEMLCGTRPFSDVGGSGHRQWRAMRAQRQQGVLSLRLLRRHTSPDVVSMVAKCLAPRPENRYPSGAELLEDITRHLECRPLRHAPNRSWRERGRKWVKRHPRLGSGINVAVIAAVLILVASVGLLIRGRQVERLRAQSQRHEFLESLPEIRAALTTPDLEPSLLRETVVQGEMLLQPYLADSTGDWRQQSSIAFLEPTASAELTTMIENLMLEFAVATDRLAVLSADEDRGAKTAAAARWRRLAGRAAGASSSPDWNDPSSAADDDLELLRRRVRGMVAVGEYPAAVPLAQLWRRRAPQDYEGWFLSGNALSGAGRTAEAEACFTSCIVLSPTSHWAFFQRGLCRLESRLWHGACEDFSRVLELRPELTGALINRALAWRELERPDEAIKDLDQALRDGRAPTRCFFLRAQIHDSQGRSQAAVEDRQIGLSREPHDPLSWVARGVARLPDDPHGALADFDAALEMDPGCVQALQNSASVLSERLGQSDAALERLTRLLQQTPNDLDATAGRCVLLARQGRYDDALGGVPALVSSPLEALYVYQAACVHALAAGDDPAH